MTLAERPPIVQTPTAQQAHREHVNGDCQPCAGGHWCPIEDRLDYLAAREDTRKGASRGN